MRARSQNKIQDIQEGKPKKKVKLNEEEEVVKVCPLRRPGSADD